jgi:hypothetical protein
VVPSVKPVTVEEVAGGVPVIVLAGWAVEPMYGVIVYPVMAPPVAGAVQVTVADVSPAVATTPVGAEGSGSGVATLEYDEVGPVPTALLAVTVKR